MADDASVNAIVRQAVAGIRVGKLGQTLEIRNVPIMDDVNAQFIANSIRERAPGTVTALDLAFLELSQEAAEVLRELFAQSATITTSATTLQKITLEGPIGNANGVLLLSGLHHHPYVTWLTLVRVGFEGAVGGAILSTLLRNNSRLEILHCFRLPLGLSGARALQPALRLNQTVTRLVLDNCSLRDNELSVIVNALGENATVKRLFLGNNGFTSNGLPHVTRLLQLQRDSLRVLDLGLNHGVFDHEENTRDFACALSKTTKITELGLSFCRLPCHAFTVIFQAVANITKLTALNVYDNERLQGAVLVFLLDILSRMNHLVHFFGNVDYSDASVLSCFHRNASVQYCYTPGNPIVKITTGPISVILERNRRLFWATSLLAREPRRTILLGVWSLGVRRLARDNAGATATYKIMLQKLVFWWAPITESPSSSAATASSSSSSRTSSTVSISTDKRSLLPEEAMGCNDNNNDSPEIRAQYSSSSGAAAAARRRPPPPPQQLQQQQQQQTKLLGPARPPPPRPPSPQQQQQQGGAVLPPRPLQGAERPLQRALRRPAPPPPPQQQQQQTTLQGPVRRPPPHHQQQGAGVLPPPLPLKGPVHRPLPQPQLPAATGPTTSSKKNPTSTGVGIPTTTTTTTRQKFGHNTTNSTSSDDGEVWYDCQSSHDDLWYSSDDDELRPRWV